MTPTEAYLRSRIAELEEALKNAQNLIKKYEQELAELRVKEAAHLGGS